MSIVKKVVVATMAAVAVSATLGGAAVVGAKYPDPINKIYDGKIKNFGEKIFNRNSQKSEVEIELTNSDNNS